LKALFQHSQRETEKSRKDINKIKGYLVEIRTQYHPVTSENLYPFINLLEFKLLTVLNQLKILCAVKLGYDTEG